MSGPVSELTVAVVASTRAWRSELQAYVRNHVSGMRLVVVREPRALFDDDFDVVVIDDVASMLDRYSVRRLRELGVGIVGVFDPDEDDGVGSRTLRELGVDVTVGAGAGAEALLREISILGPAAALGDEVRLLLDSIEPAAPEPGLAPKGWWGPRLITVVGVGGDATGVEVAGSLASALVARGERTVVVDVDEVSPALARRYCFGLEPNLLSALDWLRHGDVDRDHSPALATRNGAVSGTVPWDAIVGLANVADWAQLRDADLAALLDELRARWDRVVAVAGPHLEELDGLGPERFGASRTTVAATDALVGVSPATRLGTLGLLDWAAEVQDLAGPRPVHAVLVRMPSARFQRAELEESLRSNMAPALLAGVWFLPDDPRVEEAGWRGAPLGRGPFAKAVEDLAAALVPVRERVR